MTKLAEGLKSLTPIRTSYEWADSPPRFFQADTVSMMEEALPVMLLLPRPHRFGSMSATPASPVIRYALSSQRCTGTCAP